MGVPSTIERRLCLEGLSDDYGNFFELFSGVRGSILLGFSVNVTGIFANFTWIFGQLYWDFRVTLLRISAIFVIYISKFRNVVSNFAETCSSNADRKSQ